MKRMLSFSFVTALLASGAWAQDSTPAILEHGAKLGVRGYLGVPMLGRIQIWVRKQ